jgi:TRAP-type C4-dicarboxylate transport system substrate-binding protein
MALATATASAQIEIKFGHVGGPGSLFAQSAEIFASRANAKLGDKARIVIYGSSQLGGDSQLLTKLKLGTVDLALPSTVMTSIAPEFGVFEMPYLVRDRGHAARIADKVTRPTLAPIAEKAGYHSRSPTTSIRSRSRKTCSASSCVCREACGERRCSRPTAPIRGRCRSRRCSSRCKPAR